MKTTIEVREYGTDKAIHSVDVSGKSRSHIDRVERGMNINLNHDKFYTAEVDKGTSQ